MSLSIAVVCGSVRQDRRSINAANYISERVTVSGNKPALVDFTKTPLPFVDTPIPPGDLNGDYPYDEVKQWSKVAGSADAFILVAPEYNHGYSAVMKNGLDWLYGEFLYKPVGLVGVSDGLVGGARAIEQLRALCGGFGMYDIKETVMFRKVQDIIGNDGNLKDPFYEKQVDKLIQSLAQTAAAMKSLRN